MKLKPLILSIALSVGIVSTSCAQNSSYKNDDFAIKSVQVTQMSDLDISVWDIKVKGTAGKTTPKPAGQVDGAPVIGYVFPTSLKSNDVGFGNTAGIVAMALTSHPDFDDTPLWDEDMDGNPTNAAEGIIWHAHWVLLVEDKRVPGGLAVKAFDPNDKSVVMPLTAAGMPMYLDSPGFPVKTKGNSIKVMIPNFRMSNKTSFNYDGVTAYMQVNTSKEDKPMLGVYEVYSVASGDLSLPYTVKTK
jgi:hypothetical protein